MDELKIVHVDDANNVLVLMKEVIEEGFKNENRPLILRQDRNFNGVERDIATRNLADVYILDNEITGGGKEGGRVAQEIYDKAKAEGRKVIVINLLSSNPEGVMKVYGEGLKSRDIPVFHKAIEAPLCLFYIGDCLKRLIKREEKLPLEEWLKEEGIRRKKEGDLTPDDILSLQEVQARLFAYISIRGEGAFWTPLGEFINMNRVAIEAKMRPQAIEIMNDMFPVKGGGLETKV